MSEEISSCFNRNLGDFLISVTVHKARNLNVLNADTFVIVTMNDVKKKTKVYQKSDCPFFNEVLINFDACCNFFNFLLFSILCLKSEQLWKNY